MGRRLIWVVGVLGLGLGGWALWGRSGPAPVRYRPAAPLFEVSRADDLLEGPERDRWQKPGELVRRLGLRGGETVADVGAGSGYLLPYLSAAVGPRGRVYAEEIQEPFLPMLEKRAAKLGNVTVVLGRPEDPKLPPEAVDCFVLLTVYHEVQQPVPFLRALRRAARPGARLAIIDFDGARQGDPPPPPDHQVAEADVLAEAAAAGWELAERHELVPSQFYLVFRRSGTAR